MKLCALVCCFTFVCFTAAYAQFVTDHPWNGTFPLFTFYDSTNAISNKTGLTDLVLFTTSEDLAVRVNQPTLYSGTVQFFNNTEPNWPLAYYSPPQANGNIGGCWKLSNGILAFHNEVYPNEMDKYGRNEYIILHPQTLTQVLVISKNFPHGTMDSHGFDMQSPFGLLVDFKVMQSIPPEVTAPYNDKYTVDSIINDVLIWYKPNGSADTIYAYPDLFPLAAVNWSVANAQFHVTQYSDISHFNSVRFYTNTGGEPMMLVSLRNAGIIAYNLEKKEVDWAMYTKYCGTKKEPMMSTFFRPAYGHDARFIADGMFSYFDNGTARKEDEAYLATAEAAVYKIGKNEASRTKAINLGLFSGAMGSFQLLNNGSIISWGGNALIVDSTLKKAISIFDITDNEIAYATLPGFNVAYAANAIAPPAIKRPEIFCSKILADSIELNIQAEEELVSWSNGQTGNIAVFPKTEAACASVSVEYDGFIRVLSNVYRYRGPGTDNTTEEGSDNMNAYWNEANNEVQVYVPVKSKFSIYDNLGAYVVRGKLQPGFNAINTKGFAEGIYRIKTTGQGGLGNRKFFIKR